MIANNVLIGSSAGILEPPSTAPAALLGPAQRVDVAVKALARAQPILDLAREHDVSRDFVYAQADKARRALDEAFAAKKADDEAFFYLPVTKAWRNQAILGLTLICHSSERGVVEWFRDLLDTSISEGTVHNVVRGAVEAARAVNARQDLSKIRVGIHDEIFQSSAPVLVGMCAHSTYCYLLSKEEHRDAETWGIRLLEAMDHGLRPDLTIADGGLGLRQGQAMAMPGTACWSDVFHPLRDMGKLATFLENRAAGATTAREKLERQMDRAKRKARGNEVSKRLAIAREAEQKAVHLARDVVTLATWLREDVLALEGPDHAVRQALFDFIVAELQAREHLCEHRIGPVRRLLQNQRDLLLAFTVVLDERLGGLARYFGLPVETARAVLRLQRTDWRLPDHFELERDLRQALGARFEQVRVAVAALAQDVVRASSLVENLNSRLRGYFFLRRHLGPEYLDLLRFFLNHRVFLRSERPEREGKSPAWLLTGEPHPNWLELLGYERFRRN